jgi:ATP-dependent helicase/nuclease subunit B
LRALDPLDADPGAADRGMIIHDALARFLQAYPARLPADAAMRIAALGQQSFGTALARPGVWAFWWPRFLRIAEWVAEEEARRRPFIDEILAEITGRLMLEGPAGGFEITGRADRIERRRDGRVALIDYKTGALPRLRDIAQGYAPQLPLEAWMIERGGFAPLQASVGEIAYWRLSGGDPAGEPRLLEPNDERLHDLIARTGEGLKALIAAFDDPAMPYRAIPSPDRAPPYSDYAHLERRKEWLAAGGDEE